MHVTDSLPCWRLNEYAEYAENADYADYAEYAEYTEYAEYAEYSARLREDKKGKHFWGSYIFGIFKLINNKHLNVDIFTPNV